MNCVEADEECNERTEEEMVLLAGNKRYSLLIMGNFMETREHFPFGLLCDKKNL